MKVCIRCNDTGKYLGNGFMKVDCNLCTEDDDKESIKPVTLDKIDRRSKSYIKAIKDIMNINPDITRAEAVKMFDEAYIKG